MSTIHFVGGEKGGVGKSVMSRLLAQYFIDHKMEYCGLDADKSQSTMSRYYSEFTKDLDLEDYDSIDQIIDQATENPVEVLIDLPAQSQRFLDKWIDDNATLELCEELDLKVVFWYVVDDGPDSARLLSKFLTKYGKLLHVVVVKNKGCGKNFSAVDALEVGSSKHKEPFFVQQTIELPALHGGTLHKIDRLNLSFWCAVNVKGDAETSLGLMERQRAKVWTRKAYSAFDTVMTKLKA
jgi:hypothetical protein